MRAIQLPARTLTRCLVCGCAEVRTDEVVDGGVVLLGECPRCEHRFTRSLPEARLRRVDLATARRSGEAAAA